MIGTSARLRQYFLSSSSLVSDVLPVRTVSPYLELSAYYPVLDQLFHTLMDEGEAVLIAAP
jgi:hypothetical protein